MKSETKTEAEIETPYYCYGCGIRFREKHHECPDCGLLNCSERMSRQAYGEPSDLAFIPLGE